jgi:hypothetical protein
MKKKFIPLEIEQLEEGVYYVAKHHYNYKICFLVMLDGEIIKSINRIGLQDWGTFNYYKDWEFQVATSSEIKKFFTARYRYM